MNELAASPTPAILPAHQTQKDSSTYFIFELKAKKKNPNPVSLQSTPPLTCDGGQEAGDSRKGRPSGPGMEPGKLVCFYCR